MSRPVDFMEVVAALQARPLDVAGVYAPGGHVDGQRYWALCPWRGDRKVGSFHVALSGPWAGRWRDEATGEQGDMLDLIQAALRTDRRGAFDEARRFLGLEAETDAQRANRRRLAERAKVQAAEDAARAEENLQEKRNAAFHRYLECQPAIAGTPVEHYLAGRGIRLAALGREPYSIRFHPRLPYRHVDLDTGEVFEGDWPAMVAAIYGPAVEGQPRSFWGIHRTWLARRPDGSWGKAPVPAPKKVFGSVKGGFVSLWAGRGPRGGKVPFSRAKPGSRVYVTEGIEDGLSVAAISTGSWVAVAVSLGNMREIVLPKAFTEVVLVADNDADPKLAAALDKAIERFRRQGRRVFVWRNTHGGKDLNDVLRAATITEGAA